MKKSSDKEKRLEIANKFIKIIASYGRRFFYYNKKNRIGFLKLKKGHVYYVSEYSGKEIYLHYRYWKFHGGGTLRSLINEIKDWIMEKCNNTLLLAHLGPWPDWICNGDLWGYGDDMEKVRKECKELLDDPS